MQEIDTEAKDRFDLAELPKAALLEQFLLHEAFLTISDQEPEESTLADGVMEALDQALAAIDQKPLGGRARYSADLARKPATAAGKADRTQTIRGPL